MGWLDETAALGLLLLSLFLLARAHGLRSFLAVSLSFVPVALLMAALFAALAIPVFANLVPGVGAISSLAMPIMLFALAVSISRKAVPYA